MKNTPSEEANELIEKYTKAIPTLPPFWVKQGALVYVNDKIELYERVISEKINSAYTDSTLQYWKEVKRILTND